MKSYLFIILTLCYLPALSKIKSDVSTKKSVIITGTIEVKGCSKVEMWPLINYTHRSLQKLQHNPLTKDLDANRFKFEINNISDVQYLYIYPLVDGNRIPLLENKCAFLIEPGDSLHFEIRGNDVKISGRGSLKNRLKLEFKKYTYWTPRSVAGSDTDTSHIGEQHAFYDSLLGCKMRVLENSKKLLRPKVFNILKTDLVIERRLVDLTITESVELSGNPVRVKYYYDLFRAIHQDKDIDQSISDDKIYAQQYTEYLIWCKINKHRLISGNQVHFITPNYSNVFDDILSSYSGLLREKAIIGFLGRVENYTDISPYVARSEKIITNEHLLSTFQKLKDVNLAKRKSFPIMPFELYDSSGSIVNNSILMNKVTLLDFWFTGCGACAIAKNELVGFVDSLKVKNSLFQMVTISIDTNMDLWSASIKKGIYTHKGSINLNAGTLGSDNPFISRYNIKSYPTFLVVDEKGTLIGKYRLIEELKSAILKALDHD